MTNTGQPILHSIEPHKDVIYLVGRDGPHI